MELHPIDHKPLFSVFIPAYNRAYSLRRSIDSVLSQTYANFELLLVDDCSTDGTQDLIASYSDPRIRVFTHKINSGVQSGYITAIDNMNGQWLVPLGSTKFLAPETLEVLEKCISQLPTDTKRIRFGAANVTDEGIERIDDGYLEKNDIEKFQPIGDAGLCTHVDINRKIRPIAGMNGFEGEWGWRIRKETDEFYIDKVMYFCHRTKDGNHLSFISDNGTELMSAAEQRILLVDSADPQYFLDRQEAGVNLLNRFVRECESFGEEEKAQYIRKCAKELDIPISERTVQSGQPGEVSLHEVQQVDIKEKAKRLIVNFLRILKLKPPAPSDEGQ